MTTTPPVKHPVEARDSFANFLERTGKKGASENHGRALKQQARHQNNDIAEKNESSENLRRFLKTKPHHSDYIDVELLQQTSRAELQEAEDQKQRAAITKYRNQHEQKTAELLEDSGIGANTQHGMMIDAGSGGM